MHERTALENTKLHTEKILVLAQQVNTLQQQQSQKDKLLEQANKINEEYQHQLSNKPNPIIWIIIGLIIGLILSLFFQKIVY